MCSATFAVSHVAGGLLVGLLLGFAIGFMFGEGKR